MNNKGTYIGIHIVCWAFIFLSPLMFVNRSNGFNWQELIHGSIMPITLCTTFYVNYFLFVPKLLINKKRQNEFILINALIIIVMSLFLHFIMMNGFAHPNHIKEGTPPPELFFVIRDIFTQFLSVCISTSIRLSIQWGQSEQARKEAEVEKADAELKNLRNQINPHFLLNTLNNIYALIAFNSQKAQTAVLELSKMLRHILYDNERPTVNLSEEVTFIDNYINLMKIRLQSNVKVNVDIQIPDPCTTEIAPLIFISLIENAFKHGVSPTFQSFIDIKISADSSKIECLIENSNYPKTRTDKSGHGIGLEQVGKRLELAYSGRYEWTKGISEDGKKYSSKIIIYVTKLCNN
jgi:LytS/YehU family sensor histidine kinase